MKHALVTINLVVLAVVASSLFKSDQAGATRTVAGSEPATLNSLPLVQSNSFVFQLNSLPIMSSVVGGGLSRIIEAQTTPQAGLVLTHVSAELNNIPGGPLTGKCTIIIDGVATFRTGFVDGLKSPAFSQPMSPILVRPGQTLRIEVEGTEIGFLNIQLYTVSNSDLY